MRAPAVALLTLLVGVLAAGLTTPSVRAQRVGTHAAPGTFDATIEQNLNEMFGRGSQVFRFDTFGDERFWSDTLKLHQAIAGARNGGVGPGVSPATALAVGLKLDVDMVPQPVLAGIKNGSVGLNDPGNTLALINAKSVIGVMPFVFLMIRRPPISSPFPFSPSSLASAFAR